MGLWWPPWCTGSPLSTAGSMHITIKLRWLPYVNWWRERHFYQIVFPQAIGWKLDLMVQWWALDVQSQRYRVQVPLGSLIILHFASQAILERVIIAWDANRGDQKGQIPRGSNLRWVPKSYKWFFCECYGFHILECRHEGPRVLRSSQTSRRLLVGLIMADFVLQFVFL